MQQEAVGLVIQHGANRYLVQDERAPDRAEPWACTLRGRLRQGRQRHVRLAVIGDRVRFTPTSRSERSGVIEEVLPRANQISRPAPSGSSRQPLEQVVVANVDRLWVVASLAQPSLNLRFVDRILAAARLQGVDAGLVLNKRDLAEAADPDPVRELYGGLGLPVVVASAEDGTGLEELEEALRGDITGFVGLSGVGKSSLLRRLDPGLDLAVGAVAEKHGHGRHTTTVSRLYRLRDTAWVADTPGMREFGLWGALERDLDRGFVEIDALADQCRFRDCLHHGEPGCAVLEAVEAGEIAASRQQSYLALLEELSETERGHHRPR